MAAQGWPTPHWPEGVPTDITGYERPLFNVLDDSARDYPNLTYTIFNDATRTFAQVKETADRVANYLASRGIGKGDRVAFKTLEDGRKVRIFSSNGEAVDI